MMGIRKSLFLGILAGARLYAPCSAAADTAPPVMYYSVEQVEQDVRIVLEASELSDDTGEWRKIVRNAEGVHTTVAEFVLTQETPLEISRHCGRYFGGYWEAENDVSIDTGEFCAQYPEACHHCGSDENICIGESCENCTDIYEDAWFYPGDLPNPDEFCDLYPAYLLDCNGDETAECCLVCDSTTLWEFWDRCVPPGHVVYDSDIYQWDMSADDGEYEWVCYEQWDIEITDAGTDCEPLPPVDPEDTGDEPDTADSETEEPPADTEDTEQASDTDKTDSDSTVSAVDSEPVAEAGESMETSGNNVDAIDAHSSGSRCSVAVVGRDCPPGMGFALMQTLLLEAANPSTSAPNHQ